MRRRRRQKPEPPPQRAATSGGPLPPDVLDVPEDSWRPIGEIHPHEPHRTDVDLSKARAWRSLTDFLRERGIW
jgi:hypothetical protein